MGARSTTVLPLLCLVLSACPAPPPPHAAVAPRRRAASSRVYAEPVLTLVAEARRYQSPAPVDAPARGLAGVHRACLEAAGELGLPLEWDRRLSRAARTLASAPAGSHLSAGALTFALQGAGVMEPQARLLSDELSGATAPLRQADLTRLAERVARVARQGGYNRLGGVVERTPGGARRILLLLLRSQVRLSPVPRMPATDASILLRGALRRGFTAPRVVITSPGGATRYPRLVAATDGSFHAVVPLDRGRGVYQVEIMGTGPQGPEVLANFPIYQDVTPPQRYLLRRGVPAKLLDPGTVARALWTRLQAARKRAGLRALHWHATLARVARAHSLSMCRAQRVEHQDPTTGTANDRVQRAGLRVSWVGENVGRAAGLGELNQGFMRSPGHRAMRLHPRATHGAVGVCLVRRPAGSWTLFATELFVTVKGPPRPR